MAEKTYGNGVLSLIGSGTTFEGRIKTDGSVRVDGRLVGDIASKGNVTVGATGVVEGQIVGENVSLAGRVEGTVTAQQKLVLEAKSVMRGDIRAATLVVDEGAVFDGKCTMNNAGEQLPPGDEERKQ